MSGQPRFRTGTTFTTLEVTSEPYLTLTFRGYTGAFEVLELATGSRYELLIGGIKSLAECLEPLRASNNGAFKGLRFIHSVINSSAWKQDMVSYLHEKADSSRCRDSSSGAPRRDSSVRGISI